MSIRNKFTEKDKHKKIIMIRNSTLINISSCGLLKSKKVSISNFPGAISEDTLKTNLGTLTIHAGSNDYMKISNVAIKIQCF